MAVQIPARRIRIEQAELLGHDLEHVIEQIVLVDLAGQADARRGVVRLADGIYESDRARLAGETVSREAEFSGTTAAERRRQP